MSFYQTIYGNLPQSGFTYTTNNLSTDNVITENLSAVNASIVNLTTAIFQPISINTSNLTVDNATITNATIDTEVVQTSYVTLLNAGNAVITDATINNIHTNDIDLNNIILKEQSASFDKSIIYRDANQLVFAGRENASSSIGTDYLFYTGLKAGNPKLKISRSNNTVEMISLNVTNNITGDISSNLLAGNGINLNTVNSVTTIESTGNLSNLNVSQLNVSNISCVNLSASNDITASEVRGTIIVSSPILEGGFVDTLTGDITNLSTDNISSFLQTVNTVNASTLNSTNIFAQGAIVGATVDADILEALYEFHITDKTLGTSQTIMHKFPTYFEMYNTNGVAPYKIYTGTNTGTPDLEITSSGIIADISQNLVAGTGISLSTLSGVTTISSTGGVTDPLNVCKLNASNISCVNLSASKDLSALEIRGTAIVSSPILEGGFVDTNTGDITNLSTVNISSNIITCNVLTGNIASNLLAGTGISLSTSLGVTTIENTATVSDPLNLSKLNASNISCVNLSASNDITALEVRGTAIVSSPILEGGFVDTLTGDITNLSSTNISITNATLATSLTGAGNINITGDIQTAGAINSATINNTGDINNTTGNINLDVNTGKVYANEFNGSIGRIRSIVSAQNGSYYLNNSTGTGSFAIFSSATGDFYMNTHPSNLNFGSTSASTGPVAMTINGTTKDIEIFTNLTTADITSSGTITATALTADISSNLTGGYGITLYTVAGNTTISATTGLYFCATRTGNYAPGGGSTGYVLQYNNITASNGIAYNATNGQATIPFTGLYSISASVNIDNISVNARINIRCRIRINGSWFQGYPQAYGYIRNQNEVTYATATCSDWIVQLTQNDIIDIIAHVGVGSNTSFSSSFLGLQFFNGATFTIRRVDV